MTTNSLQKPGFARGLKREISKALSKLSLRSTQIRQNNARIMIPLIHGVGASNHMILDERMTRFAKVAAELKTGLALDVGANVGAFLIQLHSFRWFDRGGEYLGFEPNALCTHYVNELARLNSLSRADCISVALTAEPSLPLLHGHKPADKMASLSAEFAYRKHRKADFSSRVVGETGDDLLARVGSPPVSVVKIDVEGHEGDVLAGLVETLKTSKPWIFCEIWDLVDRAGRVTEGDKRRRSRAFGVLKQAEYLAYDANMKRSVLAEMEIDAFSQIGGTDVIFIPPAERDHFEAAWQNS